MSPDDLFWRPTFDALSATVPAHHITFWIKHQNRVIPDTIDHESKKFFTLTQCLLGFFSLRQVPGDLDEALKCSVLIAKGGDYNVCPESRAILSDSPAFHPVAP